MAKQQPDGIWIIDSDARTLFANSAMAEIPGNDNVLINRKPSFDYLFPEDIDAAQKLSESKQRGEASPFHFHLPRADGSANLG